MACLPRPIRTRNAPAASKAGAGLVSSGVFRALVLGAIALGGFVPDAGAETPVRAQRPVMPTPAVLEPERTDANILGIVLACEPSGQTPVLQLLVYPRGSERLLPDRRAGAAPKAEPGASIVLDDRPFRSSLMFADRYAIVGDLKAGDRTGPVAGLSDEFIAALLQARTMVLQLDLLEEEAGAAPRFDSETTVRLDAGKRAAIRAVAHCADARVAA